jgi:Fe-S cluster assembly iron-binding protein IscA
VSEDRTIEDRTIEVSDEAMKKIRQFMKEQERVRPVRILMTEGGWRGPYLVMELDEPGESDSTFTREGVTFLMDRMLLDRAKFVKIDYVHSPMGSGYTLKSDLLREVLGECETPLCQTCSPHG